MHVVGLWRYPVKSLQGEARASLHVVGDGVVGDRGFGVLDLESNTVMSGKRFGALLGASARLEADGPVVTLPSGDELEVGPALDERLSSLVGRPSRLVSADPRTSVTFLAPVDFEHEETSALREWQSPAGRFVDSRPIHLLTTATLRAMADERPDLDWTPRRFRPNLVVEADGTDPVEQGWLGRRLRVGGVELEVERACPRCVVTTREQPGGISRQLDVLRHLNAAHDRSLGVLATVVTPGPIAVGDDVQVEGVCSARSRGPG